MLILAKRLREWTIPVTTGGQGVIRMRSVRGYVCVNRVEENHVLYGQAIRIKGQTFESMETNGIVPFPSLAEATTAAVELRRRFSTEGGVRFLSLHIAETEADLLKLRRRKDLIVLFYAESGHTYFWGRPLPERSTTLYGLPLGENGLRPFAKFSTAEQCAHEVRRQGLSRASIAVFRIGPPLAARKRKQASVKR